MSSKEHPFHQRKTLINKKKIGCKVRRNQKVATHYYLSLYVSILFACTASNLRPPLASISAATTIITQLLVQMSAQRCGFPINDMLLWLSFYIKKEYSEWENKKFDIFAITVHQIRAFLPIHMSFSSKISWYIRNSLRAMPKIKSKTHKGKFGIALSSFFLRQNKNRSKHSM